MMSLVWRLTNPIVKSIGPISLVLLLSWRLLISMALTSSIIFIELVQCFGVLLLMTTTCTFPTFIPSSWLTARNTCYGWWQRCTRLTIQLYLTNRATFPRTRWWVQPMSRKISATQLPVDPEVLPCTRSTLHYQVTIQHVQLMRMDDRVDASTFVFHMETAAFVNAVLVSHWRSHKWQTATLTLPYRLTWLLPTLIMVWCSKCHSRVLTGSKRTNSSKYSVI